MRIEEGFLKRSGNGKRTYGRGGRKEGREEMIPIECMYVISFIIKTTLVLLYYSSCTDDEIGSKGQVPCSRSQGVEQHRWDSNQASALNCSSRPVSWLV